jgi:hypothetical protein
MASHMLIISANPKLEPCVKELPFMRRSNSIRFNKSKSKSTDHSGHHGAASQPALPGVALPHAPRCLVDCYRWGGYTPNVHRGAFGCAVLPAPHFHEEAFGLHSEGDAAKAMRCPGGKEGGGPRPSHKLQDAEPFKRSFGKPCKGHELVLAYSS